MVACDASIVVETSGYLLCCAHDCLWVGIDVLGGVDGETGKALVHEVLALSSLGEVVLLCITNLLNADPWCAGVQPGEC